MGKISLVLRQLTGFPIILYQVLIKPILRPCCRFYPSCSDYALESIKHFGVLKGIQLTCNRLFRCHPWSEGGYDPVLSNPLSSNKEKP